MQNKCALYFGRELRNGRYHRISSPGLKTHTLSPFDSDSKLSLQLEQSSSLVSSLGVPTLPTSTLIFGVILTCIRI